MILADLASLGSFISGIAVLASLVYLSLQYQPPPWTHYNDRGTGGGGQVRLITAKIRD